jgi:IPT/TIG domain
MDHKIVAAIATVCLLSSHVSAQAPGAMGTSTQQVSISSLFPKSGQVGTEITINGTGFTQDNTVLFGSGAIVHIASIGSVRLTFVVPQLLNPLCYYYGCRVLSAMTTSGAYPVSIQNENGTSNTVIFTIP